MLLEPLRKTIDTLASNIGNTSYGSSSLFSNNFIGEAELDAIHEFDLRAGNSAQSILKAVEALLSTDSVSIAQVNDLCVSLEQVVRDRSAYIQKIK